MKHVHSVFNLSCEDDDGEFDTLSDLGPDDSGSHNESTDNESHQPIADGAGSAADEPMPLADEQRAAAAEASREEAVIAKRKAYWQQFVVPKEKRLRSAGIEPDSQVVDGSPVPGDDVSGRPDQDWEGKLANVLESSSPSQELDPRWHGTEKFVEERGGIVRHCVPSGFKEIDEPRRESLPPTPDAFEEFAAEAAANIAAELASSDGSSTDAETRANKALDMPPCGAFGLEKFCFGRGCKACRKALRPETEFDFVEFCKKHEPKKADSAPALAVSASTMKTPPCKRPDFFGDARVSTPEKGLEPKKKPKQQAETLFSIHPTVHGCLRCAWSIGQFFDHEPLFKFMIHVCRRPPRVPRARRPRPVSE